MQRHRYAEVDLWDITKLEEKHKTKHVVDIFFSFLQ